MSSGAFARLGTFTYSNDTYARANNYTLGLSENEKKTYNSIPETGAAQQFRINAIKDRFPQYADSSMYDAPASSDPEMQEAMNKMSVLFKLSDPIYVSTLDSVEVTNLIDEGKAIGLEDIIGNAPADAAQLSEYLSKSLLDDPAKSQEAYYAYMSTSMQGIGGVNYDGNIPTYGAWLNMTDSVAMGNLSAEEIDANHYFDGDTGIFPNTTIESAVNDAPSASSAAETTMPETSSTPTVETTTPASNTTPSANTSSSANIQNSETENSGSSTWGCIKNTVSTVFTTVKNVVYSMGALVINTVKGFVGQFTNKSDETTKTATATTQVDRGAQASAALGTSADSPTAGADWEPDSM